MADDPPVTMLGLLFPAAIDGALGILSSPYVLFAILLGTAVGIVFGAIPGFSATMTIILFTPVTIPFEPTVALIFLVSAYGGAVYGGSIPAILINTPGAPGSIVTCWDGYELTKQGRAIYALAVSAIVSGLAGLIAATFLLVFAPPISDFALNFGNPEMFLLAVFALTIIPAAKGSSLSKALLAGAFGLLIGTIGNDPQLAQPRATFGQTALLEGVDFVVVLIGLFVLAEVFWLAYRGTVVTGDNTVQRGASEVYDAARAVVSRPVGFVRGALIGTFIGSLPGAGADVANFVSYNEAKRWANDELADRFGSGIIEGVIAADSSNNATQGSALIPTLTLGIPGSGATAALLGAIALHGLNPGPGLFDASGDIVYAMILSLFVGNVLILIYGLAGSQYFGKLAYIPIRYIIPSVAVLAVVGGFAVRNAPVDLYIVLLFGLLGVLFVVYDYPLVSLVLGVILGDIAESGFVTGWLLTGESATAFLFNSSIAVGLLALIALSLVVTAVKN
ncbi:tripartite tricarboxylate transporter permease [Natronococcus sp. A-GB7]|uniref:tripartite tricarboxylate transporter permease n=1 Tax=Natronococcus sp. A-GB7 TaxID=3037649 RepID=UPI00241C0701|nr:tripartite tricarboxylate transporter permease [Natronococcus sp. A-GB7]MDG5818562.1 tripartite tricarboxylate transporter permease [Natronococcus sp. A-GB7]